MATKMIPRPAPVAPAPPVGPKPEFSPSEELGGQVEGFQQAQAEIDRKRMEELESWGDPRGQD